MRKTARPHRDFVRLYSIAAHKTALFFIIEPSSHILATMKNIDVNGELRVIKMPSDKSLKCELENLGITDNAVFRVTGIAPAGDPITISVRGAEYAVRRELLDSVITTVRL